MTAADEYKISMVSFVVDNDTSLMFQSCLCMHRSTYARISIPAQQSDTVAPCRYTVDIHTVEQG